MPTFYVLVGVAWAGLALRSIPFPHVPAAARCAPAAPRLGFLVKPARDARALSFVGVARARMAAMLVARPEVASSATFA